MAPAPAPPKAAVGSGAGVCLPGASSSSSHGGCYGDSPSAPTALAPSSPIPPKAPIGHSARHGYLRAMPSAPSPPAAPRVLPRGAPAAPPPAASLPARVAALRQELGPLSQESRYHRLMAMGRTLPAYPPHLKVAEHKVSGCQSTVFLRVRDVVDGRMHFEGFSDALISAGLVALVLRLYDGQTPGHILQHDTASLQTLGIFGSLSPTRAQGLASMLRYVKELALKDLLRQQRKTGP
uniref:Fe-S metabolism associated domain-containing protein n=1 Tax=Eutreptiella gymnastica TaxID=73025 RepID=A0A7S1HVN1_9EUGL